MSQEAEAERTSRRPLFSRTYSFRFSLLSSVHAMFCHSPFRFLEKIFFSSNLYKESLSNEYYCHVGLNLRLQTQSIRSHIYTVCTASMAYNVNGKLYLLTSSTITFSYLQAVNVEYVMQLKTQNNFNFYL